MAKMTDADNRSDFEAMAAMLSFVTDFRRSGDGYANPETQRGWLLWKAKQSRERGKEQT